MANEITRFMVMQNVRFRDQPAGNRPVFAAIGILRPMKQAGDEVRYEHGEHNLKDNHAGTLTPLVAGALIDKNRGRHR